MLFENAFTMQDMFVLAIGLQEIIFVLDSMFQSNSSESCLRGNEKVTLVDDLVIPGQLPPAREYALFAPWKNANALRTRS